MSRVRVAFALVALALSASSANADLSTRWGETATNGDGLQQGDATTITWGFIADGITISGGVGEPTSGSDLIQFLDDNIGAGGGGSDLTNRPWFTLFESSFERWGEVSGLDYVYEPNDDGFTLNNQIRRGQIGVRADVRIGGHSIDGQSGSNTLAYNYFPDHGDMVIDTDNISFYSNGQNNHRRLRNVVMHEHGHGIGISHRRSNNSNFLMEPSINVSFDGPQWNDIWNAQRGYGDIYEKNGGNDQANIATSLGAIGDGQMISIGDDAGTAAVAGDAVDFISVDGTSDTDFLSFTINGFGLVDLVLNPMGPTFNKGTGTNNQTEFRGDEQSDLILALFDVDGTTLLGEANNGGLGESESLTGLELGPGTYFVRVTGTQDSAQFYQLQASFSAVPEPGTVAFLSVLSVAAFGWHYRRRRQNRGRLNPTEMQD